VSDTALTYGTNSKAVGEGTDRTEQKVTMIKINASSILTTTDRVWHGPLITVLCCAYCKVYCLSI